MFISPKSVQREKRTDTYIRARTRTYTGNRINIKLQCLGESIWRLVQEIDVRERVNPTRKAAASERASERQRRVAVRKRVVAAENSCDTRPVGSLSESLTGHRSPPRRVGQRKKISVVMIDDSTGEICEYIITDNIYIYIELNM